MPVRKLKEIERVIIRGQEVPIIEKSADFKPETEERETSKGQLPAYDGFSVKRTDAQLKFDCNDRQGESWLRLLNSVEDEDIQIEYSTGGGVIMVDARCSRTGNTKDGKIGGLEFSSPTSTEF